LVQNAGAMVLIGGSTITRNAFGVSVGTGGQLVSAGDNKNIGNNTNGVATSTFAPF